MRKFKTTAAIAATAMMLSICMCGCGMDETSKDTTDHLRQCSFDKGSRPHATSAHEQQCDRVGNQIHSRDQGSWCSWL